MRKHHKSLKGKEKLGWYQEAAKAKPKKVSQEESFVQMMGDRFEEFEKRITYNLTMKLFKSEKKDTSDKSRSFATVAKDQDNALPNLRKILREEKIKEREEQQQQHLRQKNFMTFGVEENKEFTKFGNFTI